MKLRCRFVVVLVFTSLVAAAADLPYDTNALFRSHVPHVFSQGTIGPSVRAVRPRGISHLAAIDRSTSYSVGSVVTVTSSQPEAEEHVAVSPLNSANLIAAISDFSLRGGSNTSKYAFSTNNGANWTESFVPLSGGSPATGDGIVWPYNSDPVVAMDLAGNMYLADLYFHSETGNSSNGLYVAVAPFGTPFTQAQVYPVAVNTNPATTTDEDKEWLAVDCGANSSYAGNVYVSWSRFLGNSDLIVFSRSVDQGKTWSAPLRISPSAQDGAVQGSAVATGPNGEVYVVYEVFYIGGNRQHLMARSNDGGQTFTTPAAITPTFSELSFNSTYRKNSFASLSVSPSGYICVLYADQRGRLGAQVEFVRSTTPGGSAFTAPVAINDVSTGQQFMPAVTVDGSGAIHASWFDTRNSPKSTSIYDIYATRSTDNGATFAANSRLTPSSINAGNSSFIGDYAGIGAGGGFAHPVWTNGGVNGGRLQTATLR
ncbi:MAG TPA: sialidase family protein [Planctomycetota bacterium]